MLPQYMASHPVVRNHVRNMQVSRENVREAILNMSRIKSGRFALHILVHVAVRFTGENGRPVLLGIRWHMREQKVRPVLSPGAIEPLPGTRGHFAERAVHQTERHPATRNGAVVKGDAVRGPDGMNSGVRMVWHRAPVYGRRRV